MVVKETVKGLTECLETIDKYKGNDSLFVLFCGDKDASGNSWCPDCVDAEPFVTSGLASAPDDGVFIYCSVGDRAFWKDQQNGFRTHDKLKLSAVPTLLKYGTSKRLVEEDCKKSDLVKMLFEDED
ncbi:thioredoxin domain-containing protein 17-like [Acanthaster planci]|uniref:Thioredoxin domain-containing protein 17 n=1 Tax=Acanthaster planci TaxID=133434 RepID=A0A8B7ZG14_ACAPL|nr:thioredoxin domain-containing protein 17-like [Acanthaster planci]